VGRIAGIERQVNVATQFADLIRSLMRSLLQMEAQGGNVSVMSELIFLKFNILTSGGARCDCVWVVTSHELYRFYRFGSSCGVWHN
jgi:hypothetical protein